MWKRSAALYGQRHYAKQRAPRGLSAPDGEVIHQHADFKRGVVRVAAAGGGALGSHGGSGSKQQAGGRGAAGAGSGSGAEGGTGQGEPLVLKPEEGAKRKGASGPLRRSSYRRRKEKAEESRRQRAEYLAELSAASKRARVSYVGSSASAQPGPRVALVDGYNAIHASPELNRLAAFRIQDARYALNRMAVAFSAAYGVRVYVVYDAMGSHSPVDHLERLGPRALAVFSAASEADTYIGQAAAHWKRKGAQAVMVVSNDRYVQDLAKDRDYVIYPVQLDAWLDQAHRALVAPPPTLPSQAGGGATSAAAAAADLFSRAATFRRGSRGSSDGDEGDGQDTPEARSRVLRSSWELQEELLWLASSGSEDDEVEEEMEAGAEMEEVDYLAGLAEEEWFSGGCSAGEEEAYGEDVKGEVAGTGAGGGSRGGQGAAPVMPTGAVAAAALAHAQVLGEAPPASATGASTAEEGEGEDEAFRQLLRQPAPQLRHLHTSAVVAAGAAPAPQPPPPPLSSPADLLEPTAAVAASPVLPSPPPLASAQPSPAAPPSRSPLPAAPAGQPAGGSLTGSSLSGLLGKGGRTKLAGLVKRATQGLDAQP